MTTDPIVRGPSIGDEVYDRLLDMIIRLEIPPGGRISVDALVRQLGVSQTPIRAALNRLQAQGLVANSRNVGFSAQPLPDAKRFADLFDFRCLVESDAAYKAAILMTDDAEEALDAMMEAMTTLNNDEENSYSQFAQIDGDFHNWIIKTAGNIVAVDAMQQLHVHVHLFRLRFHSIVTDAAIPEHQEIVTALKRRDADAAKAAMAHHIHMSRKRMEPFYKRL